MVGQRISPLGQIGVYLGKCFRLFFRERQWKNLISTVIIMVIVSMVTGDDMFQTFQATKSGSFAIICVCIWVGLFNSIQSICRERAIIKREHRTGLRISSYIVAHVIYEWILCTMESLIVIAGLLLKNADHLPDSGLVFPMAVDMYLTLFLVMFGSDMIAMLISCIVKNENAAMTVMPFILIIQMVMSGAIFNLEGAAESISALTLSHWGFKGVISISNTTNAVQEGYNLAVNATPAQAPSGCETDAATLLKFWGIMAAFAVLYILLSILILSQVDRDKR